MAKELRFNSLQEATKKSPPNKRIVSILIEMDEQNLKKSQTDPNVFLSQIINPLASTRAFESWLARGGYFKILTWADLVLDESKYSI